MCDTDVGYDTQVMVCLCVTLSIWIFTHTYVTGPPVTVAVQGSGCPAVHTNRNTAGHQAAGVGGWVRRCQAAQAADVIG